MTELFFSFLLTSCVGVCLAIARIIYKSKCTTIDCCCGCLHIERDVEGEENIDEIELALDNGGDEEADGNV
jgi:hypothetical protein